MLEECACALLVVDSLMTEVHVFEEPSTARPFIVAWIAASGASPFRNFSDGSFEVFAGTAKVIELICKIRCKLLSYFFSNIFHCGLGNELRDCGHITTQRHANPSYLVTRFGCREPFLYLRFSWHVNLR